MNSHYIINTQLVSAQTLHRPKKTNDAPRKKPKLYHTATDPLVNPGNPPHCHQTRSKAYSTRTHHRMVFLAQSSPGCRSTRPLQIKKATVMLGLLVRRRDVYGAAPRATDFRSIEHLVHDLSDGAGAAAAPRHAAEAAVDIARRAARRRAGDSSHLVVAQHIAGADDHQKPCRRDSRRIAFAYPLQLFSY